MASLREQEAARDATQITELTTRARPTATAITPIADGLTGTVEVTGQQLAQWRQAIGAEVAYLKTVSGMTATNIARGALRTSVEQLALALDTYTAARNLPDAARQPLLELAKRQRDVAVASWSVAATQLDQINVDAGNGQGPQLRQPEVAQLHNQVQPNVAPVSLQGRRPYRATGRDRLRRA